MSSGTRTNSGKPNSSGVFHKINEPKTTYRCNSDSDDEQISPQQKTQEGFALDASLEAARQQSRVNYQKRLNLAELNAKLKMQIGTQNEMEDEDEDEQQRKRSRKEFKTKSAQHYKKFNNMQTAKQHQRECEPQASK